MTSSFKEQSKDFIQDRIAAATNDSPIAVFTIHRRGKLCLSAVFAGTATVKRMIEEKHPDLVGVYNGDESRSAIIQSLNKALRRKI